MCTDDYVKEMAEYVGEGYQRPIAMCAMPEGDPFENVTPLLEAG